MANVVESSRQSRMSANSEAAQAQKVSGWTDRTDPSASNDVNIPVGIETTSQQNEPQRRASTSGTTNAAQRDPAAGEKGTSDEHEPAAPFLTPDVSSPSQEPATDEAFDDEANADEDKGSKRDGSQSPSRPRDGSRSRSRARRSSRSPSVVIRRRSRSRSRLRYYDYDEGVPMPKTIHQGDSKEDIAKVDATGDDAAAPDTADDKDAPLKHAIIWSAEVYDSEKFVADNTTVVKYTDWNSLEGAKVAHMESKSSKKEVSSDESAEVEWTEPVLEMRYVVAAHMPWLKCEYPEKDEESAEGCLACERRKKNMIGALRTGRIFNEEKIPKSLQEHDIRYWSKPNLVLKSPHLYAELCEIIDHYPGQFGKLYQHNVTNEWERAFVWPYSNFLRYFEKIEAHLATEVTATSDQESETKKDGEIKTDLSIPFRKSPRLARRHLRVLYDHLKPMYDTKYSHYQKKAAQGDISWPWEALGFIFKPGTVVYVKDRWTPWCVGVVDVALVQHQGTIGNVTMQWEISVWVLSSDGNRIGRCLVEDTLIQEYHGVKDVTTELDICPCDLWDKIHGTHRKEVAINRGRLLYKALKRGYLVAQYAGDDLAGESGFAGRVVIDHRRGQDMIRGLQLKKIGLVPSDKDIYDKYDGVFVHKAWAWGPQHAVLNEGTSYGRSDPLDSGVDDDDGPSGKYSSEKKRAVGIVIRRTVPLVAEEVTSTSARQPLTEWTPAQDEKALKELNDDQLRILYPLTFAFSLKAKEWIELDTSRLEEVKKSDRSYDSLVLPDDSKKMIQAVVRRLEKQETETTWSADFVTGKGSGGIILLHGPPGVGKTFTVEAIAEKLDSPLLALTVADIGTQETTIERKLLQWFTWAEMWKAVLLIDEADIFLERRHTRDLTRNGLVSAFLRRAEYFDGLLFLTTNRVGHIDDAFISRVQIPVLYRDLTGEQLAKIWEHFFSKLQVEMRQLQSSNARGSTSTSRDPLSPVSPNASGLGSHHHQASKPAPKKREIIVLPRARNWVVNEFKRGNYPGLNGRDIRNSLQAAITLAEYDAFTEQAASGTSNDNDGSVMVDINHFSDVLEMSCNFRKYISGIRNADEPERAHHRGDRPFDDGYAHGADSPSPMLGRQKMGSVGGGGGGARQGTPGR